MMRSLNTTAFGTEEEQALGRFTCRNLQRLSNWNDWLLAEAKQLYSMVKQEMYGDAILPPPVPLSKGSIRTIQSSLMGHVRHKTVAMVHLALHRR
jgi:hypothetical protein